MSTEVLQVQQRYRITLLLHLAPHTGEMSAKGAIAVVAPLHLHSLIESDWFFGLNKCLRSL